MSPYRFLRIALTVLCLVPTALASAATLDPLLRNFVDTDPAKAGARPWLAHVIALDVERERVGIILHLDGGLPDLGGVPGLVIGSVCGEIATARVPTSSLAALAAVSGIRHVSAARLMQPHMDVAVSAVNVDQVWNGSPAWTGDGVLVGVIDTGLDTDHADFRNSGGLSRVEAIWDMFGTGTPPDGFAAGVEYTAAEINSGAEPSPDLLGHGTHVTGIAAGNGRASSGQYSGVAPEAGILFVDAVDEGNGGFAEDNVIDAMNYLVGKAQELGKPIAINMSFGGHYDAHDGSSPREIALADLSGTGAVFCVSAGNEGEALNHESGPASDTDLILRIPDYTAISGASNDYAVVVIWIDGDSSPTVTVGNGSVSLGPISPGNDEVAATADGSIEVSNPGVDEIDPANGDKAIYVYLHDSNGVAPEAGDWTIHIQGGGGTAHAWRGTSTMTAYFPESDQSYSVGVPACAEAAVAVGAFKSRNTWPATGGTYYYPGGTTWGDADVGDRAPFSSIGPNRIGGEKPDVVAPGMAIVSCRSSDMSPTPQDALLTPDGNYYITQGTSMASPLTCGIAALMFEKNPSLTAAEVRQILRTTAATDSYTGATWNARFGAGKVDALAALASVPHAGDLPDGDVDDDDAVTVLDIVLVVNYILDEMGHPLAADQREMADVHPSPAGDGMINASDVTRLVAFILGTDQPGTKTAPELAPVVATVGTAREEADGWWLPLTLRGEGMAAGQFALSLPEGGWRDAPVRVDASGGVCFASRRVGTQLRTLFYDLDNELPDEITVWLPCSGLAATPGVAGLLIVDATGSAREIAMQTSPLTRAGYLKVFPNPAPGSTSISFGLARAGEASIAVYDLSGRLVKRLRAEDTAQTEGLLTWHGDDDRGRALPAGVYLVQMRSGGDVMSKKVVLQR